jgi:hypothetical protein
VSGNPTPQLHPVRAAESRVLLAFLRQIISGGDTGVARAALDWAMANGIEHGGWCPAHRKAEDGIIPSRYALQEIDRNRSGPDIRANVAHSDAMLVLNLGVLDGWTDRAVRICRREKKPVLVVQIENVDESVPGAVRSWLLSHQVRVLYVAGPREGKRPGITTATARFLESLAESA